MAVPVRQRDDNRQQAQQQLRRRDPMRDIEEFQQQMGHLMESLIPGGALGDVMAWVPPVDIEETEDAWLVEAELPGVSRDDVDVEVRGGELRISGEVKEKERTGILRRKTRRVGRFEYRVVLPGQADVDGIDARMDGGVLTVHIPKSDQARPRRIDVKSS